MDAEVGLWDLFGPEKWATIPENATQDLSRYTTIAVVSDRATGWRGAESEYS